MTDLIFDDFFDQFVLGFGKPKKNRYNAGHTKDMSPVFWQTLSDENGKKIGYRATCRTVGISPDDVKVSLKDNNIVVEGRTEFSQESVYDCYYEIPVADSVVSDIEKINYKTENGLTYVTVLVKEPIKSNILIEREQV